ncbi:MAG TPA: SUMF1/EgtB/PvdO family nonheme iron enzyme [Chitinispirillaceae bacterium]|nr:SUMF1/EgtB/PvdO family nonheme iron enzyme [Chitinispirillaceae bacterium]
MSTQFSAAFPYRFLFCMGLIFQTLSAQDKLAILTGDIKAGPSVYYSTDALSHFSKSGQNIASQVDKEVAFKSFRATITLANMGLGAIGGVPVLLEVFPKAYHVSMIKNVRYAGEGTFEDWVQTYITSEKNKFLLASPFLDYNSMSLCEQHIESSSEIEYLDNSGKRGQVNIIITFILNIGSCALQKITGMDLGNDQAAWQKWWQEGGNSQLSEAASVVPVVSGPALSSGQAFSEIQLKGKYRMSLMTGDELIGVVESKDDTSLVLETTDGKPYAFSHQLLSKFELLAPPPKKSSSVSNKSPAITEVEEISYDELKNKTGYAGIIEVKISNGSLFKGKVVSIDESMLTLGIEGSNIPIAKGVISQISLIPVEQKSEKKQLPQKQKQQSPDTIFVKNTETDDFGKPKEDLIVTGEISTVNNQSVMIKLTDGTSKEISRAQINRIIKHSSSNYEETIKRYAKPLFCPDDMFLVDIPPGKQGRPFFKVCVDRYEYPNQKDVIPQGNVTYRDAQVFCEKKGKRLCTQDEWQWACSGLEGYTYPYGWNRDDIKCNTDGTKSAERSGSRLNCVSKYGGYDMVGNIFEWVTGKSNEPMLMGGPYSKCQTVSPGVGGGAKPQTGFRCCKSN